MNYKPGIFVRLCCAFIYAYRIIKKMFPKTYRHTTKIVREQ